jgi:ubiquinone/menaquinone biosynthesis C-methylase UbiE
MTRIWYPFLTRRLDAEEVTFLNYGYEEDPPLGISLDESDEPNRCGIQLYHQTATELDLGGRKVLEVSCGHGGGASYLTRTLKPAAYTGLDSNPDGIAYCRRRHILPGLDFVHGDAENLPFPEESFDAVINIEASHAYPQLANFLAEVARVLRPDGHFLYADFRFADMRGRSQIPGWEAALANIPMRQVSARVINASVLRSLDKNSERSLELIGSKLPALIRPFGRRFAGLPGSALYRGIRDGKIEYRMYCFTKE